ncbi:MAG TPA: sugar phosphate isomerase/epimerase [Solimonas sp.]|nr:sugar phosphate isomerase/epimerase [Solimonas sp.]
MSLHDRLSVHSICFADAGIDALFDHWSALGARRVSFSSGQVLDHGAQAVRAKLDAGGRRAETMTHVLRPGALSGRDDDIAADRARLRDAIAAAATIGARSIYLLSGGRGALDWQAAAEVFAETVAPCRAIAAEAGVALAIENASPLYADLHIGNSLRDTIALAEQAGIGVCIDVWDCWTEAGLPALIERAMPICRVIQLSDHVPGDRALPCRAVPGDGAIPLRAIVARALALGYDGAFDLELIGPRIDREGHRPAVARAADVLGAMLRSLGA